jgi:hypothetical protein|tara:strand:+ start:2287 stop:2583 length:297 start_codon:yes stop_codon:yes gene_type:complete
MQVSECCGAKFHDPGYPDNDICSSCGEHAGAVDQDRPSINVVEMPEMPDAERGLIAGYKPNRLSLYILLLVTGRQEELYEMLYDDMGKYKIKEGVTSE